MYAIRSYYGGFATRIRKGKQVTAGQTIGYVGASGEATGPHLDYRIRQRGTYINPLSARFDPVDPLREEFKDRITSYNVCYTKLLRIRGLYLAPV